MIYLQIGLYAEGPTDYDLLLPLLFKLTAELVARYPGSFDDLPDPLKIDEHSRVKKRAQRIAEAIERHPECRVVVVHADADGDARRAREERIEPGITEARRRLGDRVPPIVACVPVREIEAWMLADEAAFRELVGKHAELRLPREPERSSEPDRDLDAIFRLAHRKRPRDMYAFMGKNLGLPALRRLPAFRAFEAELTAALEQLAGV